MIYRQAGQTSAQALAAIKARYGDEVIVIATNETREGVEVVFTVDTPAPVRSMTVPSALHTDMENSFIRREAVDVHRMNETAESFVPLADWLAADAIRAGVWQAFHQAGFSGELARHLLESLPRTGRPEAALRQALESLQLQLKQRCDVDEIIDQGGVHALVGPTGSGKTTTIAKLAVRCLAARGKGSVAIITTDTYRIGAIDQLNIYGRVLGVKVLVARSTQELSKLISEHAQIHLMLVDTMGLSPRDARVCGLVSGFAELGIHRWLVLSAASQASVQRDVIRRFGTTGLSGCILSKLDEAGELGGTLDAVLRHGLSVPYVSVGQRVPEDLHRADAVHLAYQALPDAMTGSFRLESWLERWRQRGLLGTDLAVAASGDVTL